MNSAEIRTNLVGLGMIAVIAQALLIREAMATLAGSEIVWGCLLCLWLTGASIGAWVGSKAVNIRNTLARFSPSAAAISAVIGAALIRATPTLSGAEVGETGHPTVVFLVWLTALVPPSVSVGLAFSALGNLWRKPATAYALECLGATIGGLVFTFLLAPWGTPIVSGFLIGAAGAVIIGIRHCWWAGVTGALGIGLGLLSADGVAAATWRLGRHAGDLHSAVETHYQRLEVSQGDPQSIFSNSRLVGTLPPDPYLVLPRAELLPLIHVNPRRIAVIGGLTSGMVTALLEPPIEHLTVIEEDRGLINLLRSDLDPTIEALFDNPRASLVTTDPTRAISGIDPVDLILLLDDVPATIRANRSRTLEFFRLCRSRLAPGGVIIVLSGVNSTYTGGQSGRLLTILASTLGEIFPDTMAIASEEVFLAAGFPDSGLPVDQETLIERWRQRGSQGTPYLDQLIPTLMDFQRSSELTRLLETAEAPLNTVSRPSAVLPAATLSEGRRLHFLLPLLQNLQRLPHWTTPVGIILAALGIVTWGLPRRRVRSQAALAIGFASMTWYLLLLAAWQGSVGAVYSEIGGLTAVFMAGMVGGSVWSRRVSKPSRALVYLLPLAAGLSLLIGSRLTIRYATVAIPFLLTCGGLVTGGSFAGTAALAQGDSDRHGIGRAFSADEAGAGLAALVVGVIGLPLVGTQTLATASAVVCLAAMVGVGRHRSNEA